MRLLFISDDDQCRGPLACLVAERVAATNHLRGFRFESAGLFVTTAEAARADLGTVVPQDRATLLRHRSQPLTPELLDSVDIAFAMTDEQVRLTRQIFGAPLCEKVVQLVDAVQLTTRSREIVAPELIGQGGLRRTYASLSAAVGRLIRMLDDPGITAESFGARSVPRNSHRQQQHHHQRTPPPKDRSHRTMTAEEALTILGTAVTASSEEIRRRYLDLLKRYHPDRFHDDEEFRALAEEKTKRLNRAWELLRDR